MPECSNARVRQRADSARPAAFRHSCIPALLSFSLVTSILINPVSGGATASVVRARVEQARVALRAHGEEGAVIVTERRGHATELAADAVSRGERRVVSWGGDGTMNEVASALAGTETVLGLIPSGSGNGLARELGIPREAQAALEVALRAEPRRIDAGQLDGRWFFSIAGIGFDAQVAASFDRAASRRRGFGTYARITARELLTYRAATYRVGGGPSREVFLITLANSAQFGNGMRIAPGARVDDGVLDLVVFEERSRVGTILNLPRLVTGTVERARGVTIRQVTETVIESDRPMAYHVDGEPRSGGCRLDARVKPGALLVAAPSGT